MLVMSFFKIKRYLIIIFHKVVFQIHCISFIFDIPIVLHIIKILDVMNFV